MDLKAAVDVHLRGRHIARHTVRATLVVPDLQVVTRTVIRGIPDRPEHLVLTIMSWKVLIMIPILIRNIMENLYLQLQY